MAVRRFISATYNSSGFAYPPIEEDEIRILLLQPAIARDADLEGSLQCISLAQQYDDLIDPYTALSYVWGDPTPVDKILIGGQELGITANLSAVLRDLRDSRRTHRLWADAVCIDQGNIHERSQQVARMGQIYGSAGNTIIYLGPLNPYIDAIIELARHHVQSNESENDTIDSRILCKDGGSTGDTISLADAAHRGLLANPWFRRIWVLQELVLSRVPWVQCGLKRVRWLDLCRLLIPQLEMHRHDPEIQNSPETQDEEDEENKENHRITALEAMNNIRAEYHESSNSEASSKRTLWQVLQSRKGCQVSDPRDIVFAHMGIISDRHVAEKLIRVDYSQAVSEVFVAMGRYVRYHDGFTARRDNKSTPSSLRAIFSLPSWVPDCGVELDRRHLYPDTKTAEPTPSPRLAHVFPLTVWGGAEVIALSGVLPPSSSFEYMKMSPIPTWNDVIHRLPATTKIGTLDEFGLRSWPRRAVRLIGVEHNEEVLAFQDKMVQDNMVLYLQNYARSDMGKARLALLNSGMIILVPPAALPGDIVVFPVKEWSWGQGALTVRRCESRDPTDLSDALKYVGEFDNFDPKGLWFLHASLVGACALHGVAKTPGGFTRISYRETLDRWYVPGSEDERRPRVLVLH